MSFTNPNYWKRLPDYELKDLHKCFEEFRHGNKNEKRLPAGVRSMQDLLTRTDERKGIEKIIYDECINRNLI